MGRTMVRRRRGRRRQLGGALARAGLLVSAPGGGFGLPLALELL